MTFDLSDIKGSWIRGSSLVKMWWTSHGLRRRVYGYESGGDVVDASGTCTAVFVDTESESCGDVVDVSEIMALKDQGYGVRWLLERPSGQWISSQCNWTL